MRYSMKNPAAETAGCINYQKAFTIITEGDIQTLPDHFDPDVLHAFIKISSAFDDIFNKYYG